MPTSVSPEGSPSPKRERCACFSGEFTRLSLFSQDPVLAELLHSFKDQIVGYHEHDSLLDHKEEEALSEEERKAAWAEYEAEKKVSLLVTQSDLSALWKVMKWWQVSKRMIFPYIIYTSYYLYERYFFFIFVPVFHLFPASYMTQQHNEQYLDLIIGFFFSFFFGLISACYPHIHRQQLGMVLFWLNLDSFVSA